MIMKAIVTIVLGLAALAAIGGAVFYANGAFRLPGVADIIAYKEQLQKDGKTALTIASYINSIRRFYTWAEANKIYPNIAADVHAPKRQQEFKKRPLSVRKVGELLSHEQANASARDYAIINLMARTGLRCVEVVRANIGDIVYMGEENARVLLVRGKGRDEKDDFVKLTDAAYFPILEYLNAERKGEPETAPLFASTSPRRTLRSGR